MKVPKVNIIFRLFDLLLSPFMWILGKFTFPLQETHMWHVRKYKWGSNKGLKIKGSDDRARFGHGLLLGHVPIMGGLTKYVVIEALGFKNYWNIGWENHIQILKIKQNRIKFLVGKDGYVAYGLGDNGKNLTLKIVGYGELGDGKYKGVRLF